MHSATHLMFKTAYPNLNQDKPKIINRLPVEDAFATAHFTRIIKCLEFIFLWINSIGFLIIFVIRVQDLNYSDVSNSISIYFTYLIVAQVLIEIILEYFRAELSLEQNLLNFSKTQNHQNQNSQLKQKKAKIFFYKIRKILKSFFNPHALMILVQPNMLFSDHINQFLLNFGTIRTYIIVRFYYITSKSQNPRHKRVIKSFGLSLSQMNYKIAFSSMYFKTSVCAVLFYIIFGIGNFIREQQNRSTLQNLLSLMYYLLITISTVGYGDITVSKSQTRLAISLVIVMGIFLTSLMVVTVIQEFSFTKLQKNAYFLRQKLMLAEQQQNYVVDKLRLLLVIDEMEGKFKDMMSNEELDELTKFQLKKRQKFQKEYQDQRQIKGQIQQLKFQFLINNMNEQMKQMVQTAPKYRQVLVDYYDDADRIGELRSKMQFLKEINPISGQGMQNQVNKITYKTRAVKYKNNVLKQIYQKQDQSKY